MKFRLPHFILFSLLITVLVLYQNCGGGITLQPVSTAVVNQVYGKNLGDFCAPAQLQVPMPQKVFVIIDMSSSNVNHWYTTPDYTGKIPIWDLGQGAHSECLGEIKCFDDNIDSCNSKCGSNLKCLEDCMGTTYNCGYEEDGNTIKAMSCPPPTDLKGTRFEAIKDYFSGKTCPGTLSSSNLYGVIGFSDAAISSYPTWTTDSHGNITYTSDVPIISCDSPLSAEADAITQVQGFENLQKYEVAHSGVISASYPFIEHNTSYAAAFTCMGGRIQNTASVNDYNKNYKVLFITDGQPSDYYKADGTPNCAPYITQLKGIVTSLPKGYSITLQPIYYGVDPVSVVCDPNDPSVTQCDAKTDAQTEKTNAINCLNLISGSNNTIVIDPSGDFSSQLSADFCNLPSGAVSVDFTNDGIQLFSLTSMQIGNQLYADNDMDGVNDDLEHAIGEDSTNPRSKNKLLLDAVCNLRPTDCASFTGALSSFDSKCDVTKPVGFGFSECDKKFIDAIILQVGSTSPNSFNGIDYDNDGMLDYIELIKGTNPFLVDMNTSPDGDSMTVWQKLLANLDPNSFTSTQTNALYNDQVTFSTQNSCSSRVGMNMSASNMSFVDVPDFTDKAGILPHHDAHENVFVSIYYARPSAFDTEHVQVFGRYLFMKKNGTSHLGDIFKIGTVERK